MVYVYRHIRLDTNTPFYIGIGSHCAKDKIETYSRAYSRARNILWKRIADKTNYRVEILFENLTREEACNKEKEFILLYGRQCINTGTLANLTAGGDGLLDPSTDVRDRISKKAKLNHLLHPEKYKHTLETRQKMSASLIGKSKSEEHKAKLSISHIGKIVGPMTEEQKIKISIANKGNKRPDVSVRNKNRIGPCNGKVRITNGINSKFIPNTDIIPSGWNKWNDVSKKVECPHCKQNFDIRNAKRWHFDKCRNKNNITL